MEEVVEKYSQKTRKRKKAQLKRLVFVKVFQKFAVVVDKCFHKTLVQGHYQAIDDFHDSYRELGISIHLKVHLVFEHVGDYCRDKGFGLGVVSEHTFESVHRDFFTHWERHLIKYIAHPQYGDHLKKTLCEYNAGHL